MSEEAFGTIVILTIGGNLYTNSDGQRARQQERCRKSQQANTAAIP
jgi:hypothetical protein